MEGSGQFATVLATFAVAIGVFMLFRWVVLWYFRINEIAESQKKIVELLTVLVERSRKED